MQINVVYDASVASAPAGFKDCVAAACAFLDATFVQPVTITLDVGYGEIDGAPMNSRSLGQSQYNYLPFSVSQYYGSTYNALRAALLDEHAPGASTIPAGDPTGGFTLWIPTVEAKALGISGSASTGIDGWIGISSTASFSFDPSNRAVPGAYDLVGTLEHEITEVMGRTSSLGTPGTYSPLDLFRYDAAGDLQLGQGGPSYFSIDGGSTSLDAFNNRASGNSGDLGDWAPSAGADSFLDNSPSGQVNAITQTDITVMEALGWMTASSTPPSGAIAWSAGISQYNGVPGGHFSIALPFASTAVSLSLAPDESSVDLSYFSGSGKQVDTFTDVEFLQFSDKTIFVENADGANIARLYAAALGRAPDIPGLGAWENAYLQISAAAKAQGPFVALAETPAAGLSSIAAGFTNSPEFLTKYGELSDTAFVTQLYENVLDRAPDAAGLAGWVSAMETGSGGQIYTREMALVGFAESPESAAKIAGDWLFQI